MSSSTTFHCVVAGGGADAQDNSNLFFAHLLTRFIFSRIMAQHRCLLLKEIAGRKALHGFVKQYQRSE